MPKAKSKPRQGGQLRAAADRAGPVPHAPKKKKTSSLFVGQVGKFVDGKSGPAREVAEKVIEAFASAVMQSVFGLTHEAKVTQLARKIKKRRETQARKKENVVCIYLVTHPHCAGVRIHSPVVVSRSGKTEEVLPGTLFISWPR